MSTTGLRLLEVLGWELRNGTLNRASNDLCRSTRSFYGCARTKLSGKAFLAFQAIIDGLIAAGFRLRVRNRVMLRHLATLFLSLVRGSHTMIPHLKAQCFELRSYGLGASTFDYSKVSSIVPRCWKQLSMDRALQLSYIARALPKPGKRVCEESLRRFDECVHSPSPVSPQVEEGFRLFLRGIDFNDVPNPKHVKWFGRSSCLGSTRQEGGRSSLIAAKAAPLMEMSGFGTPSKIKSADTTVDRRTGRLVYRPSARMNALLGSITKTVELPASNNMEVVVVKELGYKARIVTKSEPTLVAFAHEARTRIWPVLRAMPQAWDSLGDPPSRIFIRNVGRSKKFFVYSADFSAATDGLSHRIYQIFCDKFGIDPHLVYEGMSTDGRQWTRGAPMGLPCSWLCLELVHYCIARYVDPNLNFRIRGDDLIAVWTVPMIEKYSLLCDSIGLTLNRKKSFRSRCRGTFCETMYGFDGSCLFQLPTLSLRFLQKGETTDFLSVGGTCEKFLARGFNKHVLKRLVFEHLSVPLKVARRMSIDIRLPIQFGGMGLPFDLQRELPRSSSCKVMAALNGHGVKLCMPSLQPGPVTKLLLEKLDSSNFRLVHNKSAPTCKCWKFLEPKLFGKAAQFDALCGWVPRFNPTVRQRLRALKALAVSESVPPLDGAAPYARAYALRASLQPLSTCIKTMFVKRHGCD